MLADDYAILDNQGLFSNNLTLSRNNLPLSQEPALRHDFSCPLKSLFIETFHFSCSFRNYCLPLHSNTAKTSSWDLSLQSRMPRWRWRCDIAGNNNKRLLCSEHF